MAAFDSTFCSSPVLTMPAQPAHQSPFDRPAFSQPAAYFDQPASWSRRPTHNPSGAGRKRSRDEAAVNLDAPEKAVEPPIKEAEEEWVYGPGMILIKPNSGYVIDASSQSGTWLDEKTAEEDARKAEEALVAQEKLSQARPSLRSNKSQRLEMTPDLASTSLGPTSRSSPTRDIATPLATPSDSAAQPVIDDFTLHLGIGWSRMSDDEDIQAAARGWARYIENHYPISDVKIRLQSRGLQSYLVEAHEGFFLFAEDLRQGQLVSQTADGALENLKSNPPALDGTHVMEAAESPKPLETISEMAPAATSSIDMDMS